LRALLVDDQDNLRRLIARMLQAGGLETVEFSNGADALAWSDGNAVDVLVTDVTMEGMDGSALAEALVKRNPDLLVVFISGLPFDIEAERQKHPYCAYVQKPFPSRTLLPAIAALEDLRQRRRRA
jgi:two-component system cell cycle sensor histidine kinase/response regulator CckA